MVFQTKGNAMKSKAKLALGIGAAVGMVTLGIAMLKSAPPTSAKEQVETQKSTNEIGDTFIPLPTTPDEKFVALDKIDDRDFAWLTGRKVKVRMVTGQGLTQPLIYPVYVLKSAELEHESVGANGEKVPAKVKVFMVDLLEHATTRAAICGTLPHRVVSPEGNKATVGLFVDVPHRSGNPILLAESQLNRNGGKVSHELVFTIDPAYNYLLTQPIKQFSLEFKENYIGQFRQHDLQVSVNQSLTAIQEFRNTVQRGSKPEQKVAFVAFGGGVTQDTGLKRQLQTATEVQLLVRKDAILNPSLLDRFLNDIVKPELVTHRQKFDPQKDADQTFTYFLGNGMSVQGTIGQLNKVELRDRFELERLMENNKSWDKTFDLFTKLGLKIDVFGLGGGSGDVEFKLKKNDIGSESNKNYSKDIRDLFQAAEGKLPVVALDVAQLQKAEQQAAQALQLILGTFTVGRRSLFHSVSFQTLAAADEKMATFKSELAKKVDELKEKIARLQAQKPHVGNVRLWHVNEGPGWAPMLNPNKDNSGRSYKKWIAFPDGRFAEAPNVIVSGFTSIDAHPIVHAHIAVTRIEKNGFEATISTWGDTLLYELDFSYVAIPK